MTAPASWQRSGLAWPNRDSSRFIAAGGIQWHLQDMGEGPVVLLLHGTGAATHSWARLAPLLAAEFRVLAPDLPGHGFTELATPEQSTLPGVARLVQALLEEEGVEPDLVIGHSAGAAILARMCLDQAILPRALVSLNGAFVPFGRAAAPVFSGAARMLASSSIVPWVVALQGWRRRAVERLIEQTGSRPDRQMVDHYRALVRQPRHITGTLRMMANWDLECLWRELPQLETPLYLLACADDEAVSPSQARRLAGRVPGAQVRELPDLGHLGHEEAPDEFAGLIREIAAETARPR